MSPARCRCAMPVKVLGEPPGSKVLGEPLTTLGRSAFDYINQPLIMDLVQCALRVRISNLDIDI